MDDFLREQQKKNNISKVWNETKFHEGIKLHEGPTLYENAFARGHKNAR